MADGFTPGQASPARRSWCARHKILTALGAFLALIVVLAVAKGGGKSAPGDTSAKAGPPAQSASGARKPATGPGGGATEEAGDSKKADAAGAGEPAAAGRTRGKEVGNGSYIVGEDMPSGVYVSKGANDDPMGLCTVATEPKSGKLPQFKAAKKGEQVIVTLADGDGTVTFSGCEPFAQRR
ncbi:hypothetical protein IPZ58_05580 [Streptomyces roseoverticillatus]|uniref:hypothetical protein n=1 Tax=Streptomyces roseoverticillatus TaxID=66429 RepID=UPI001F228735|nr:hypothetical protein [Streptomyces roseoverticillatus]MCF3101047.1 hypothetical protein [Streptomyces roseoverticillatus]